MKRPESFDRDMLPVRQNIFFLILIWIICRVVTLLHGFKLKKYNMEGLRPPFLVYSTHHAFMDFYVAPVALFPYRANYISELEGFVGKEWLYRQVGCICKRKFISDLKLIKNIKYVLKNNRDVMVIYPEARYANIGTNSDLPESVGKLAKLLEVPVVVLNMRGNYLDSPIWNLKKRHVRLEADLSQIVTAEEIKNISVSEINERINRAFVYDDYKWQQENMIKINYKKRAEGLEKVLYLCPACKSEFQIKSEGVKLFCNKCKREWILTEYGFFEAEGGAEFPHPPDWYEFERREVRKLITSGNYITKCKVRIESLPNAKGFINLGEGEFLHNNEGFFLDFCEYGQNVSLHFAPFATYSVHTEYDYRGKGMCITLSTSDNTYFIYPIEQGFNPTKIQFAAEELFRAKR